MKYIVNFLALLIVGLVPLSAGTIGIRIPDTTITKGTTVLIPIYADSSFTGQNVTSYEAQVTYNSSSLVFDSVLSRGSLTSSWGNPTVRVSSGKIIIAAAGTSALSGTGALVYLKVTLPRSSTEWGVYFELSNVVLNEGTPPVTTRNGYISFENPPSITVYPDNAILALGETQQFNAYGGTEPYLWSTTDSSIARIDASGMLTAMNTGTCRVVARDQSGIVDTTSPIEVHAFRLSVRDTSYLQGQSFLLPVYITDLSRIDVYSGEFSLTFDTNIIKATGIEKTGTVLASTGDVSFNATGQTFHLAFASSSRLTGNGTQPLVFVRFLVTSVNSYGTWIQFSPVLFNENMLGIGTNGYFYTIVLSSLSVYADRWSIVKGDSVQFYASGTISQPLTWSVSDTALASVSGSGMVKAKKGGTIRVNVIDAVGAKGQSNQVQIYDATFSLHDTSVFRGRTIELPLYLGNTVRMLFSHGR